MKNIYFVRHGEAEGNVAGTTQTPDTPLTERGIAQAGVVAERVQTLAPEVLFTSPFYRATQTAQVISERLNMEVHTLDSVHELQRPKVLWGKKHDSKEWQEYKEHFNNNMHDPKWRFEDEETFFELIERCKRTYQAIVECDKKTLLIVSHGNFIRLFSLYVILRDTFSLEIWNEAMYTFCGVVNTGVVHFTAEGDQISLVTYNDRSHFAE